MSNTAIVRPYLRGIIHCHSRYSYDSLTSISAYLRVARRQSLDFIILTDHDTIAGSQALKAAAALRLPHLQVPIAAEYLTDEGDVIAAFIDRDVRARKFADFVTEVREQNGLLLLPHPYVGHQAPEKVAAACDLVEVFNSRTGKSKNSRANELAASQGKYRYAGADAHFARSICGAVVEVENRGSLRSSILNGSPRWNTARTTSRWEFGASQLIKAWKRRDASLALRMLRRAGEQIINVACNSRATAKS
jgi:predicted metal-dependent phosphoesterase TrpH